MYQTAFTHLRGKEEVKDGFNTIPPKIEVATCILAQETLGKILEGPICTPSALIEIWSPNSNYFAFFAFCLL